MSISEPKPETMILYNRINQMQPNETLSYTELSSLIGSNNILYRKIHWLESARRMALHKNGIVTVRGPAFGLKRLDDEQIALSGRKDAQKTRRHGRRVKRKHMTVSDVDKLTDAARTFHDAALRLSEALALFSSEPRLKRAGEKSRVLNGKLSIGNLAELFK